ncbi:hypothetical protein [Asaia lannensis]|uniref:hypothetical protein n=1 Tax=Asaia lannensis TaxID=415421 RepID=UPI001C9A0D40
MTWRPSANILRPAREHSSPGCYPGVNSCTSLHSDLVWPPSSLNGGGDYSIDFDAFLAPGEYISAFRFDAGALKPAWTNLFGTIVTAWFRWSEPGLQTVTICAVTSHNANHQVVARIMVMARPSLFPAEPPPAPGSVMDRVTDEMMDRWLMSLPTDPDTAGTGWYNNAGIPTRLGALS